MNAASFSRLVVAGAVLLSARCLAAPAGTSSEGWAQAVPSVEITNAPAFETAASSNAQNTIQQWLYPVLVERVEIPLDDTHSDPAALTNDWAYTNAGRVPPGAPMRPHINLYFSAGQPPTNNHPVDPAGNRFEYRPMIEFTNVGYTAGSTVQSTNQQWEEGLLELEVATDPAPSTSWDKPETNVTGSVKSPVLFEVPATNTESYNRGSLYFP